MMSIDEMIAKRRRSWEKRQDINYDGEMVMAAVQALHASPELSQQIKNKPYLLIELCMTIVDKKKRTVPFFLNEVQRDFVKRLEARTDNRPLYVLKGRQQGFTSLITAIQLCFSIVRHNFSGFTIANSNDNTLSIFNDKARVPFRRLPKTLQPHEQFNNRTEMFFDKLNSSWRIATATKDVGRSKTINFCHFSEVAFYECPLSDLQKSIGEAFVEDAIVVYETTANGYNEAQTLWESGTCINLFYEWWRTPEYASNDLSVLSDLKGDWIRERVGWLRDRGLTDEQIAWYVKKYNSYIDKRAIQQEYPCTPDEAFIASGDCEFGNEDVVRQLAAVTNRIDSRRGYFIYDKRRSDDPEDTESLIIDNIRWIDDANGEIAIHTEPETDDERGEKPYSIGGDTAGEGSDYFAAKVIDNITGKTVATYHRSNVSDDAYAEQIYCLGLLYNKAIIGIEVNYSYAPTQHLFYCGYPNLYMRERIDSLTDRMTKRYGFQTNSLTRPVIIAELKQKWHDSEGTIEVDKDTLREMLTFVRNDKGKPEALSGKHDDLVMALAIAHHVSKQGKHTYTAPEAEVDILEKMFPSLYAPSDSTAHEYISWE